MTRATLLVSSVFSLIVHISMFMSIPIPFTLKLVHSVICVISILNLSFTYPLLKWMDLKWTDRMLVGVGFAVDYSYTIDNWFCRVLLWISICSYLYSKVSKQIQYHIFSDLMTTVNHVLIYTWLILFK